MSGEAVDMDRLEADARACLAFLVAHQREWGPTMEAARAAFGEYERPVTLIGDMRERAS